MPTIDTSRIPAPSTGYATERIYATSEQPGAGDGTGAFRTVCDYSHMAFDDPIVFPGQPGRSHLHTFFGNTGANGNSTPNSIATTGNSTCRGGIVNRSAYWVPAMIDTKDGTPLKPKVANMYYKTGYNGVVPSSIQPIPQGLRMIAGNAKATSPVQWGPVGYTCTGPSGDTKSYSIPNCPVGSEVSQDITFPQCWDGVNLDSPDHMSHMAYSTPGKGCPSSHPVPLTEVSIHVVYAVTEANSTLRWRLSSDNYSSSTPGGYSSHADWMNGWKPEIMDAWIRGCNRPALDCRSHLLGDGRGIY